MNKVLVIFIIIFSTSLAHAGALRDKYRRSVSSQSDSTKTLYKKAYENTDIYSIIDDLKKSVSLNPKDKYSEKAQFEIGKHYYLLGDYNKAVKEFEIFLKNYYETEYLDEVYYYLGLAYLAVSDKENAILCFDKIIYEIGSSSNFYDWAIMAKGDLYYKLEIYNEAEKYYLKALANIKDGSIASSLNYKMGLISQKQGKWEDADKYFKTVLKEYPLSNESLLVDNALNGINVFSFSVQVGSFFAKENACKLRDKLLNKNYEAFVVAPDMIKDKYYRVRVGHFNDRQRAVEVLSILESKENVKGDIVP